MLSNRKKLFIRYDDEDLPTGRFSFDAGDVDPEGEFFDRAVRQRLQETDSVGKVKIKKGDDAGGISLPSQTDIVKTLASGFIRNRKLNPVLKELQDKSYKDLTFGLDDSKESNELQKKIASSLNIYLTDPGNLVVFLRKLCSKDGPATDLFLDHLKKRVLKETYTDESENVIRRDLQDGLSIGQIYTIRMPDWVTLALGEFGIQNFYPYLNAKIFSYLEDVGFVEEFISAKENLVTEEKDRAEKEKQAQNIQENNQSKTSKSTLAGGGQTQSSSDQEEKEGSQEDEEKTDKDNAKDKPDDDGAKDPNDPATPDKEKNNKGQKDTAGQAPIDSAPSSTSSSTAPSTRPPSSDSSTPSTPTSPQTSGTKEKNSATKQTEDNQTTSPAVGSLNPVPTLTPEEIEAKKQADAQEEEDYYRSQGYTGKQDFINKNTQQTYTRNPDGTIVDNDLANLGRNQGRARAFTKFKNADGSFQRIVLPATPGRSGEISQNDLEKPDLEYIAKKLGRGFKTPSLGTPNVNSEYGQDIIDEYKSTGQASKSLDLASTALAAGQAATNPVAAAKLFSQASEFATKAAQRAKAFRESTELLKSLKRRRIVGAIFGIISALAPLVFLMILIFGIMATTAYVYCKPVENIRNTIELALGVAAPGATAAATAIGAGIDVSEGKAPELALKSPLRVILEKNVCKYINDCSADQSANTNSPTNGGTVVGNVSCLYTPKVGNAAVDEAVAFAMAVGSCGIEAPCGDVKTQYSGINVDSGYFGRYQWGTGLGGRGDTAVVSWPDYVSSTGNTGQVPDTEELMAKSRAGDTSAYAAQDKVFIDCISGASGFKCNMYRDLVPALKAGDFARAKSIMQSPASVNNWEAMGSKADQILDLYQKVLVDVKAGKCSGLAKSQIPDTAKKLANYDAFDPGSIINPFQPITAQAQSFDSWLPPGNSFDVEDSGYRSTRKLTQLDSSGGIDFTLAAPGKQYEESRNTPIVAHLAGEVTFIDNPGPQTTSFGSFGNVVAVYYPSIDTTAVYSHLESINVKPGDQVSPGALLGRQGSSGSSRGDTPDGTYIHVDLRLVSGKATSGLNASSTTETVEKTKGFSAGLDIYSSFFTSMLNYYEANTNKILSQDFSATAPGTTSASSSNPDCPIDPCGAQTGSNVNVSVSSGDQYVAAVLAILESPTLQGRLDVAQVIANRVANNFGGYGTSVRAQAFASGQFEPFFNSISRDEIQDEASAVAALQKKGYSAEQARSALKEFLAATQDPVKTAESESKIKNFVYFNGTSQYAFKQPQDFLRQDGENFFGNGWYNDNTNYKQASIGTIFNGVKVSSVSKPSTLNTEQNLQNYLASLSLSLPVYAAPSRPADYNSLSAAHKDFLGEIARINNDSFYREAGLTDLTTVDGQEVNKAATENLTKMKNAAASQGVILSVVSGFRSYNDQVGTFFNPSSSVSNPIPDSALFDDSYQAGSLQYQNSRNAYNLRSQKSAPPGYSEHHTGLALDFNSVEGSYWATIPGQNTYNWLRQNAGTYGFVQSFPESAGDRFEQWHWRYDGTSGSPAINEYKGSGDTSATTTINCTTTSSGTGGATTYTGTFINPAPGTVFTSPYGTRVHPITGVTKLHGGIDLGGPIGTPILAAAAGKVVNVGFEAGGFGNYIVILHEGATRQGTETLYAHLNSTSVKEGDNVTQGQVIGELGTTGGSTGPHLHFELLQADVPRDPCTKLLGVCG